MSPKDDEGQEWEAGTRLRFHYGIPQDLLEELAADHRDAQQLRGFRDIAAQQASLLQAQEERVRVLEEDAKAQARQIMNEIADITKTYWDKGRLHHSECHWDGAVVLHCVTTCPERIRVAAMEKLLIEHDLLPSPAAATEGGEGA